jgi:hypothetical protein
MASQRSAGARISKTGSRALWLGWLEIWINPLNGWSSSRIRKTEPDTDNVATNSAATAVVFEGPNSPKLKKRIASQKTTMTSKGVEIELPACSNSSQRIWPRSTAIASACAFSERWAELAPSKARETMPAGSIHLGQADLNQVLSIYAQMSERTVLRLATLPAPPVSLKTQCVLSKEEALYAFATVLALNGICVVDDRAKFVQVVPMAQQAQVKTHAPKPEPGARLFDPEKVPSMGVSDSPSRPTETDRSAARRLLELYAGLAGKTAVASTNFDGASIWFHVETSLTRGELLYAIETTFTLNGLAIIPVDDHRIRVGRLT